MQFEFKTLVPSSSRRTKHEKKICRPKTTFDVLLLHLVHRNSFNKIPEGGIKPNAEPSRALARARHSIRLNEAARAHTSSRNSGYYYLRRHWCAVHAEAFANQLHFLVIVAGGNATPRPTINNRMFFCIVLQFLCSLRFSIAAFYRCFYALFISIYIACCSCLFVAGGWCVSARGKYEIGFIGKVFHSTENIDQTSDAFYSMFAVLSVRIVRRGARMLDV